MPRSPYVSCVSAAIFICLAVLSGCGSVDADNAESVATLAGQAGGPGFFDGTGTLVRFSSPSGVAVVGINLFVADTANHVIRKIDTATGTVSTLAGSFGISGSVDGTGAAARFNSPAGIVAVGTILFVSDTGNHTIRRIVSTSGAVTTLAGTPGTAGAIDNPLDNTNVLFSSPKGIASDLAFLYVADSGNHKIRRVTLSGATTTYAGSGNPGSADNVGTSASFSSPEGVAAIGLDVYVADTGNHTIRKLTPSSGAVGDVTTFAGAAGDSGFTDAVAGPLARFFSPSSLAAIGTDLYVADSRNHVIRKIASSGFVTTLAGTAGISGSADSPAGTSAGFNGPKGIGSDGASIFVADTQNHAIRKVTTGGAVTTAAGNPPHAGGSDGTGSAARFRAPAGAAVIGDNVFVSDTGNGTIRKITSAGVVTIVPGTLGPFASPVGIVAIGTTLYVCDNVNHTISSITATGTVTTLAGLAGSAGSADGTGSAARFSSPQGIATDGTDLFVADTGNHTIRRVTTAGSVTTPAGLAGNSGSADGSGSIARFNRPQGIAAVVASLATTLYVADTGNHTVRRVAVSGTSGTASTFAGTAGTAGFADGSGATSLFSSPSGIAAVGSILFLADTGNHAVRRIGSAANVTTFVGNFEAATTRDGDAPQALLNAPAGIAGIDGTIFFTDVNENVLRKILF
jgi:hypothetical protein